MSVKAVQQRPNKKWNTFLSQIFFSFIAGVVDTSDEPLLSNISKKFQKFEMTPML